MPDMRLGLWLAAVPEDIFNYKITKYKFLLSRHKYDQRRKIKKEFPPSKL